MFAIRTLMVLGVAAALGACGGGGSDGPTSPVVTIKTFDLKSTYANYLQSSSSQSFAVTGSTDGIAVTGSGTTTIGSLQSGTFEGVPALVKTMTISGTITGNGQTFPYGGSQQSYYDTNYNPLGSISNEYSVVTSFAALPTAAKINDAGLVMTQTQYPSSAKAYVIGTSTVSYSLGADTDTTAILTLFTTERTASGGIVSNSTATYRINTTNSINPLGETYLEGTTSLTLTYR